MVTNKDLNSAQREVRAEEKQFRRESAREERAEKGWAKPGRKRGRTYGDGEDYADLNKTHYSTTEKGIKKKEYYPTFSDSGYYDSSYSGYSNESEKDKLIYFFKIFGLVILDIIFFSIFGLNKIIIFLIFVSICYIFYIVKKREYAHSASY